ncbi:hypothetical protein H4R33_006829 [Dimargaris cristalligena]|nr:hypothetical protein H4R33_006829 [Dimargaris cristalligena]
MSNHDKPLIAVIGATGAQGVEMVECNLSNLEQLVKAFQGAYGLFAATNFWQPEVRENPAVEVRQGQNIADVAKQVGIQHLVFSSLPDAKKISGGKYTEVAHFNTKAEIETYIKSLEIPTTVVNFGYYMTNWTGNPGQFRKRSDGDYEVDLSVPPTTVVPPIDTVGDGGHCVVHCFRKPQETLGQPYDLACGYITLGEMIDILAKVGGKKIHINVLTPEEAAIDPILYGIKTVYQCYEYIAEFGYFGGRDLQKTFDTFGSFNSFEDFLHNHNWKLE